MDIVFELLVAAVGGAVSGFVAGQHYTKRKVRQGGLIARDLHAGRDATAVGRDQKVRQKFVLNVTDRNTEMAIDSMPHRQGRAYLVVVVDKARPDELRLTNTGDRTASNVIWSGLDRVGNLRFRSQQGCDIPPATSVMAARKEAELSDLDVTYTCDAQPGVTQRFRWSV